MFLHSFPKGRSQRRTTGDNAGCKDNARAPMNSLATSGLRNAPLALWRRPTHAIIREADERDGAQPVALLTEELSQRLVACASLAGAPAVARCFSAGTP
jgi:hypothetical protein